MNLPFAQFSRTTLYFWLYAAEVLDTIKALNTANINYCPLQSSVWPVHFPNYMFITQWYNQFCTCWPWAQQLNKCFCPAKRHQHTQFLLIAAIWVRKSYIFNHKAMHHIMHTMLNTQVMQFETLASWICWWHTSSLLHADVLNSHPKPSLTYLCNAVTLAMFLSDNILNVQPWTLHQSGSTAGNLHQSSCSISDYVLCGSPAWKGQKGEGQSPARQ